MRCLNSRARDAGWGIAFCNCFVCAGRRNAAATEAMLSRYRARIGEYLPVRFGSHTTGCRLLRLEMNWAVVQRDGRSPQRVALSKIEWDAPQHGAERFY